MLQKDRKTEKGLILRRAKNISLPISYFLYCQHNYLVCEMPNVLKKAFSLLRQRLLQRNVSSVLAWGYFKYLPRNSYLASVPTQSSTNNRDSKIPGIYFVNLWPENLRTLLQTFSRVEGNRASLCKVQIWLELCYVSRKIILQKFCKRSVN